VITNLENIFYSEKKRNYKLFCRSLDLSAGWIFDVVNQSDALVTGFRDCLCQFGSLCII